MGRATLEVIGRGLFCNVLNRQLFLNILVHPETTPIGREQQPTILLQELGAISDQLRVVALDVQRALHAFKTLYRDLCGAWRDTGDGRLAVLCGHPGFRKAFGLKPAKVMDLFNGPIPVKLYAYDIGEAWRK